MRRAARHLGRRLRSARRGAARGPHRGRARLVDRAAFHELGAEALSFDSIVAAGENGPRRTRTGRRVIERGHARDRRHGLRGRRLLLGLHPHVRDRRRCPTSSPRSTSSSRRRSSTASRPCAPACAGADVDAASRTAIAAAGLAEHYGHGLGHGVGLEVHEAPTLRPESTDILAGGNVVTRRAGHLPPRGRRRVASRTRRRHRDGLRAPDVVHEGAADVAGARLEASVARQVSCAAGWPTSSARTSSRRACTSSIGGRCGGSSTSST